MIRRGDWTPDEDAFLLELEQRRTEHAEIAHRISTAFGRTVSVDALEHRLRRLRATVASVRPAVPPPAFDPEEPPTDRFTPVSDVSGAPYVPRPPRGPMEKPHFLPKGHELGGVSRLKDASGATIQQWDKTRIAGADQPPVAIPESFHLRRASVMRRGDGSTVVEWASFEQADKDRFEAIKAAIVEHVATYVRSAEPVAAPKSTNDDLLVVYPLGDPHIGMLAWAKDAGQSFDLEIAERELAECMRQMVTRSPAASEAIVGSVGDTFHADDNGQRTPKSGNKLDVDGRAGKVAQVGTRLFRTLIDTALTKHARVRVRIVPGNHDPVSSLWLSIFLRAVYERDPRVTVEDPFAPYQYDRFGKVLLGWCHGDGAKLADLGEIMATDVPELWGATVYREWLTGHIHHEIVKELRGCIARALRTLAAADAWAKHAGFRSGQSLQALAYHKEYGLDSIAVVGVERVRAALRAA